MIRPGTRPDVYAVPVVGTSNDKPGKGRATPHPMRLRPPSAAVVALILIVCLGIPGTATGQTDDESYWGEHTLNGFVRVWPAVVIAVLAAPLAAATLGFFELDATSALVLLAAIAFLTFHYYLQPRAGKPRPTARSHDVAPPGQITTRDRRRGLA